MRLARRDGAICCDVRYRRRVDLNALGGIRIGGREANMTDIDILGKQVPVEFLVGAGATIEMDEGRILEDARAMAALIAAKAPWRQEYADAFRAMNKIVFFEGTVIVNTHPMDRPCCDQDDAVFYWESSEFNLNRDADVHANTFFHDCWHVIQFQNDGFPQGPAEEVEREIDAIAHQVVVAQQLGCSEAEVNHLTRFAANPDAIRERLREGVQFDKFQAPHRPGAFRPDPTP